MNSLIEKGSVNEIPGYNCKTANGERLNVVNPPFGIFMLIVGIVMQIIYPIYYYVIYSKGDLQYSSYKQCSLLFNSIATGIFLIFGIEFCDDNTLIYVFGCLITGIWVAFTTSSVILLFNRIVEIYSRTHMNTLFGGVRPFIWCAISFSIGVLAFFFCRPVIFNAAVIWRLVIVQALSWIWDPQIPNGGFDYLHYSAPLININNIATCSIFVFLYLLLSIGAIKNRDKLVPMQIEVLKQSSLIGLFSLATSSLYILMQFVAVPAFIITLSFLFYVGSSVIPGLVFVLFNFSVREAVIRVFTCSYRVTNNHPHITIP
ncbi:hypothetical protein PRIPAC_82598 [Pristionchus pacificus]|uniref:G protein-coupled receptor n=1 Tax=Pristionchus pacificus TaxID=54126 RepID=A0A2A6BDV6_PRIPA|nr:hypothetical protein PRIPAC_82598 [Pristionchus pacificus]|eukprot:PDM64062.1 G protein-coupled receptor [Pristionchus pacificus]